MGPQPPPFSLFPDSQVSTPHASIHPCKHPQAMKRILDQAARNGKGVDPAQALFFFLKFIANMVPTIDYDFTHDAVAG